MKILWVGTKAPAPPDDGGRLVALLTLRALAEAGHDVTLVAPEGTDVDAGADALRAIGAVELVRVPPSSRIGAALRSALGPAPATAVRHDRPALRRRVEELLARDAFDVVHAEQPHALAACAPAAARGLPLVLRAHNVETDLWEAAGREPGLRGLLARREARRVMRWEAEAVRSASATVALSHEDAARLRALAGTGARVVRVAPPFPAGLAPGATPLPGAPAVVVTGSGGWLPNERGVAWFEREVWPRIARAHPGAHLHLFGGAGPTPARATRHARLADSRDAFVPGSVHAVPLLFGSGVRMRILEAWARGVPVVATPAAAAGLGAADGRELLMASTPDDFASAVGRAVAETPALVAAGRARLAEHHDPRRTAEELARVYGEATRRPPPSRG